MRALAVVLLLCGCVEAWRSYPPETSLEITIPLPTYRQRLLKNGATFIFHGSNKTPQVVIELALRVGTAAVPAQQAGLFWLWLSSIGEADAEAQRLFAALGDFPAASVDADSASLSLRVAATDAEAAITGLARLVRSGKVDPQVFERRRLEQLQLLRAHQDDPYKTANRVLAKALYGPTHPLAQPSNGFVNTVSALTLADLEAFHKSYVGPKNLAIVVAGAVSEADALALTDKAFGDWQAEAKRSAAFPPPQPATPRKVYFVSRAGLGQSLVMLGGAAPTAGPPDEAPFRMALGFLDGSIYYSLGSRREELNDIDSDFFSKPGSGYFAIRAYAKPDATASVLEHMMEQAAIYSMNRRSQVGWEIVGQRARFTAYWNITRPFNSLDGVASAAGELFCTGRSLDEHTYLLEAIRDLRMGDLRDVSARYLARDSFQIVVLGERRFADQVAKLKLGPMEIVEAD